MKGYHIAIILDGNRRFAKKQGLMPWKGHEKGVAKVKEFIDWCISLDDQNINIRELTLYSFSVENFNRAEKEKNRLFKLFKENIKELDKNSKLMEKGVKINFIGRLDMFPNEIVNEMQTMMEKTKQNNNYTINFAMAYGGRTEIIDATKKIAANVKNDKLNIKDIDEELFSRNLYLKDEPEIVIRPGGEKRISNFLIWQSAYSEWFFLDKLWPEITKEDLKKVIEEYKHRERRFGK